MRRPAVGDTVRRHPTRRSTEATWGRSPHLAEPLFRLAARRICATHAVDHHERLAAIRFLAANVVQMP